MRPELDLPGLDVVVEPVSTGTTKFDLFYTSGSTCAHQEMYWPDNAAEISRIVNGLLTNRNSGADS